MNPILSLLDEYPVLDHRAFALAKTFSAYYGCSLGEAIETFLPKALRQDKFTHEPILPKGETVRSVATAKGPSAPVQKAEDVATLTSPALTVSSVKAETQQSTIILVHDQAREQRWPVVIEHIQRTIEDSKSAIVLVPENFFIEDTLRRLSGHFAGRVVVFDRGVNLKDELGLWENIRKGIWPIVIGTRSAVFAPLPNLGLIVIDQEENEAYKQEQSPHYRVHEVARMRAGIDGCRLIFISAAPSAEIWEKAGREKWETVSFARNDGGQVQIIDMNNYNPAKTSLLSFALQDAMRRTLDKNGTILLYLNRLGFSTRTHCQQCGFIVRCERCDVHLTYLYSQNRMVCRHCSLQKELPKICPACKSAYLRSSGMGIEKLESEVARLYPTARVHRFDRLNKIIPKGGDIILATQAILRRRDAWSVSLVGVLNFDAQLNHVDFRSGEKAFALLVHFKQLAAEKLLIQTRLPDNYCLQAVKDLNFVRFYGQELKQRRELRLPPYRHLVALVARGKKEDAVFALSKDLFGRLEERKGKGLEVSDPHPDVNPKLRDQYRFTIIVKGKSVKKILKLVKAALKGIRKKNIIVTVNVDP